jgi:hypothetical protein
MRQRDLKPQARPAALLESALCCKHHANRSSVVSLAAVDTVGPGLGRDG